MKANWFNSILIIEFHQFWTSSACWFLNLLIFTAYWTRIRSISNWTYWPIWFQITHNKGEIEKKIKCVYVLFLLLLVYMYCFIERKWTLLIKKKHLSARSGKKHICRGSMSHPTHTPFLGNIFNFMRNNACLNVTLIC